MNEYRFVFVKKKRTSFIKIKGNWLCVILFLILGQIE